jgi:hypothetical protein
MRSGRPMASHSRSRAAWGMHVSAAASMISNRLGSIMPAKRAGIDPRRRLCELVPVLVERPAEVLENVLAPACDLVIARRQECHGDRRRP